MKNIKIISGIIFIIAAAGIVGVGWVLYETVVYVDANGLKSLLDVIWNGSKNQ